MTRPSAIIVLIVANIDTNSIHSISSMTVTTGYNYYVCYY